MYWYIFWRTHSYATLNLSEILSSQGEYEIAYQLLFDAIEEQENRPDSDLRRGLVALGQYHHFGLGTKVDLDKAIEFYNRAEGADMFGARDYLIGDIHWKRGEVDLSILSFNEALNLGNAESGRLLGNIYFGGLGGVPQDYQMAAKYYNEATAKGATGTLYMQGMSLIRAGEVRKGRLSIIAAALLEQDERALDVLTRSEVDYQSYESLVHELRPYSTSFMEIDEG